MQVYLAQANAVAGDVKGNVATLRHIVAQTEAELIVFPELFLTGYPPGDLLLDKDFLKSVRQGIFDIQELTEEYPHLALVVGMPWQEEKGLFNSAAVFQAGSILGVQHKRILTNFRLFHEARYFSAGLTSSLIEVGDKTLGLALGLELDEVAIKLKLAGADLIINPVAIPFRVGEKTQKVEHLAAMAEELDRPVIRVGQVGGNDGLIFAGGSAALNAQGQLKASFSDFTSGGSLIDVDTSKETIKLVDEDETAQVFQALVLGLRDYVQKSGMSRVILGLSGGLDSAVAAVIAARALGSENVWGITQPGPYSSQASVDDSRALAENLKIRFDTLPITKLYETVLDLLEQHFANTVMNVAEENIQARLRGNLLMAMSNKFGGLVLSNSNKSELAVGYCTLYGDMSGGLAVLADCYKTMVYQLAHYINREREIIPRNTIEKPPSAELRPDQRDDQTLPPYDVLDAIIKAYLDEGLSVSEIIDAGYDEKTVRWVTGTIDNNEYKRRQAALILRVTTPTLGYERNMPLATRRSR